MATAPPVRKHYKSQLWTIHGNQYDLDEFVKSHPGGTRAILLGKGRDCTELFESYHVFTDAHKRALKRFAVTAEQIIDVPGVYIPGQKESELFDWESTPFYDDLRHAVRAHFKNKSPKASWFAIFQHGAACISMFLVFPFWLKGEAWTIIVLPMTYWLSFSDFLHTGGHFALSKNPTINLLLARLGFLHCNLDLWFLQHSLGHHCYTNLNELDPDLNHFLHDTDVAPGYRLHPEQPFLSKYRWWPIAVAYQSIATTMAISFLLLPQFLLEARVARATEIPMRLYWPILCERFTMFGILSLASIKLGAAKATVFVALSWAVHGFLFYTFSQISHCNGESFRSRPRPASRMEWAKWQVLSALDYGGGSWFWGLASIGLNQQILHHLFPTVHPCHYNSLRDVVHKVAQRHGIDYLGRASNSFWGMLRKYFRWLCYMNNEDHTVQVECKDLDAAIHHTS